MPTTLERTTVTHTPAVKQMLAAASEQWPGVKSSRELMLKLMAVGQSHLRDSELEEQYAAAYAEWDQSEDAALWDSVTHDGLVD